MCVFCLSASSLCANTIGSGHAIGFGTYERLLQLGVSGEMASVGLGELMLIDESEPLWLIIGHQRCPASVVLPAVSNCFENLAERDEWSTYVGEGAPWHLTSQLNKSHEIYTEFSVFERDFIHQKLFNFFSFR